MKTVMMRVTRQLQQVEVVVKLPVKAVAAVRNPRRLKSLRAWMPLLALMTTQRCWSSSTRKCTMAAARSLQKLLLAAAVVLVVVVLSGRAAY
jgi:hypothetical protein